MRTTLDIEDDVLRAAKELADQRGITTGQMLCELARKALKATEPTAGLRNGVPLLQPRDEARPVTLATVNALRDSHDGERRKGS